MSLLAGGFACAFCGEMLKKNLTRGQHLYCGPKCRKDAEKRKRRKLKQVACAYERCRRVFAQRHGLQRYCSTKCRDRENDRLRGREYAA